MLELRHRPGRELPRQSCDESRPARTGQAPDQANEGGQAGAGSAGDESDRRHATRRSGTQGVTQRYQQPNLAGPAPTRGRYLQADTHRHATGTPTARSLCLPGPDPNRGLIVLPFAALAHDDVPVMHPIAEFVRPVLGRPSWLVKRGHGSFVTAEFGRPEVEIREPRLMPVAIEGAPAKTRQRHSFVHGEWHLWIYCCQWSLMLEDAQLAHCESDDVTIHRALHVLNGQALTAVEIEPSDGRTRFSFDLGCTLLTLPAEAGVYEDPVEQWYLYARAGLVLSVRSDGTYKINDRHQKREAWDWRPVGAPVRLDHEY
jgi:hypothetical protein